MSLELGFKNEENITGLVSCITLTTVLFRCRMLADPEDEGIPCLLLTVSWPLCSLLLVQSCLKALVLFALCLVTSRFSYVSYVFCRDKL